MLKGISPLISPELLSTLYKMGHGDELVIADAHFPCHSVNHKVIRADGLKINELLRGILPLFELDDFVPNPITMMSPVEGDSMSPVVLQQYQNALQDNGYGNLEIEFIERFDFYDKAKTAFAVLATGDTQKYANIVLKKGVTPL